MEIILTIIKLVIILGVVATVHEFGHFIFAKLFKMKVDEFSIGFGKALWSKEYKGTKFSLRILPLGGYCAIDGEEGNSDEPNAFCNSSWWKRIIVLVAGVIFNAILASIIFISIHLPGTTNTNKIVEVERNTVAYEIGLKENDIIKSINNKKIRIIQDIILFNDVSKKDTTIKIERDGKQKEITTDLLLKGIGYIGVYFDAKQEEITSKIDIVEGGSAAQKAGLRAGDVITSVNDIKTKRSKDVIEIVLSNPGKKIGITIERDGKEIKKTITPKTKQIFNIGNFSTEEVDTNLYYAVCKAGTSIKQIINSYVDLFKGNVNINQLSGIVGMGEVVSKTEGTLEFLNMLAIISFAVGIANILPFPPLDGGKVVLVLSEVITRKKVSYKLEAILSYIGLTILILLTLYVTYNDIVRIF
ncbi:MAG: RIP metalloprotease RseP [Clostridia bacterium]|nr:RIP metalloprotease RseP [Clostridia bacterium]